MPSLQMGEIAMKKRSGRSKYSFEFVFQLAIVEQVDGCIKDRRHGEFDLIWSDLVGEGGNDRFHLVSGLRHEGRIGRGLRRLGRYLQIWFCTKGRVSRQTERCKLLHLQKAKKYLH